MPPSLSEASSPEMVVTFFSASTSISPVFKATILGLTYFSLACPPPNMVLKNSLNSALILMRASPKPIFIFSFNSSIMARRSVSALSASRSSRFRNSYLLSVSCASFITDSSISPIDAKSPRSLNIFFSISLKSTELAEAT